MAMELYHQPVLLDACVDALITDPDGIYVDVTFGGGGHSKGILNRLSPLGRLYGFDQDDDSRRNIPEDNRFRFVFSNFRHLQVQMRLEGLQQLSGILADLGVSSFQFDEAERGFTHRMPTKLDMRMNRGAQLTAAEVLNTYDTDRLWKIFEQYGEIRNSRSLAKAIGDHRQVNRFSTNEQLLSILDRMYIGDKHRYYSQVFQALRIEVNDEMQALQELLVTAKMMLKPGGRLVVLTYHSLEDRLVKNYMKSGTFDGSHIQDDFGKIERPFRVISKKPILPSNDEIRLNSRARSAKLRIAEKN
jgi:16S rRNA (cytosine1402-N4)-methyltransferase